jgi:hypothetical protein
MTIQKQFKQFTDGLTAKKMALGLAILVLALLIFQAGIIVGYHKAAFSFRFGDNYYRGFERGGPRGFPADLPGGHGAIGKIVKINLPTITVIGPDNIEKIIVITDDTLVRHFRAEAKVTDLKVGDFIVTIGSPDDEGRVVAKLVRLMPPPPTATSTPNR